MARPDYLTNAPKGWCGDPKRGAAFGRPTICDAPGSYSGLLYLKRIHLNSGGYDKHGAYFGLGQPLYWCANAEGTIDFVLRAWGREDAKKQALKQYPKAQFYR
jgi:hypothetical protein